MGVQGVRKRQEVSSDGPGGGRVPEGFSGVF